MPPRKKHVSDVMALPVEELMPEMPSTPPQPVAAPMIAAAEPAHAPRRMRHSVIPSAQILGVLQDERLDMSKRIQKAVKLLEQQHKQLTKLFHKTASGPREKKEADELPAYQRYIKERMAWLKEQHPDMGARERMVLASKDWKMASASASTSSLTARAAIA